ncbi:MAG: CBS domain-containing protein [Syntrophorhabdaceae bacterium]|nr:CBS domain-containing protein [Syntrophorhabdaceae bacterium]MDD5245167.1 CBS domain-containing protein [Syntrophorhabdaceae bacterium]
MKTVKDMLKSKKSELWFVAPTATVFDALKIMGEKEIGALMVMDAGKVVGIISERDYARKVILKGKASKDTLVKEIMTSNMFSVKPENTVEECMVLITGKHIRHLPVFDKDKFVGIVSVGDVVKSLISEQEKLIEQLSDYISGKYI